VNEGAKEYPNNHYELREMLHAAKKVTASLGRQVASVYQNILSIYQNMSQQFNFWKSILRNVSNVRRLLEAIYTRDLKKSKSF
jgi:hypothetical protein